MILKIYDPPPKPSGDPRMDVLALNEYLRKLTEELSRDMNTITTELQQKEAK